MSKVTDYNKEVLYQWRLKKLLNNEGISYTAIYTPKARVLQAWDANGNIVHIVMKPAKTDGFLELTVSSVSRGIVVNTFPEGVLGARLTQLVASLRRP